MIERHIEQHLKKTAFRFPITIVLGPSKCGKITLVSDVFHNYKYVSFKDREILRDAQADPINFFSHYSNSIVIHEAERFPNLLDAVKTFMKKYSESRIVLIYSYLPVKKIPKSLMEHIGFVNLLPFSIMELEKNKRNTHIYGNYKQDVIDRDTYISSGFMPDICTKGIKAKNFYIDYFLEILESEKYQLAKINNKKAIEIFIRMLAGRIGQVVNLNSLAGDIGVSSTTLASWMSELETGGLIYKLPSYVDNFGKRLTKSPKIYFTDVGFAAYLLGIENEEQIASHHLLGNLFENMVVIEALKACYNAGKKPELYYLKDNHGFGVNLIIHKGEFIIPVEIKAARTYDFSLAKNVCKFAERVKEAKHPCVIYAGEPCSVDGVEFKNFRKTGEMLL